MLHYKTPDCKKKGLKILPNFNHFLKLQLASPARSSPGQPSPARANPVQPGPTQANQVQHCINFARLSFIGLWWGITTTFQQVTSMKES